MGKGHLLTYDLTVIFEAFGCTDSHTDFGKDVEHNCEDCECDPHPLTAESPSHVLRHGVHASSHVNRDEEPTEQQYEENCLLLISIM